MTDQGKKLLTDVLNAIELIESFVADISAFSEYQKDLKTQSAVERQLAIIGEAVNKFDKLFPSFPLEQGGKIIAVRNRLIHAYDNIDGSIIWAIIQNHLKGLKQEVEQRINR
jgi:uncharacterized protein with HEPN domain